MKAKRLYWIDATKLLACTLVALGHLLQSFVQSGIMPATQLYLWFNQSIYAFHVPLFFICSGFLYQRNSNVHSFSTWKQSATKKLIQLGVPYIVFTIAIWLIKKVLANDVNSPVGALLPSLFCDPIMQYWYLYCLILLFIVIPTAPSRRTSFLFLAVAVCLKVLSFSYDPKIFAVSSFMQNAVWFVLGMCLSILDFNAVTNQKKILYFGSVCFLLFICCSYFRYENWTPCTDFFAGLLACSGIICLLGYYYETSSKTYWLQHLAKYTMSIYLMHTLFAAAARIILLKIGIRSFELHMAIGLICSFIVPVIAAKIMLRTKWLSWILIPQLNKR